MTMIRTIIIDDESKGRQALQNLMMRHCPEIQVVASCGNAKDAIDAIEELRPDLIFLDVEMPDKSGLEMLSDLQEIDFQIIFTTAHSQYAIEAFKHGAIAFLLKPVEVVELRKAVERAKENIHSPTQPIENNLLSNQQAQLRSSKLVLSTQEGMYIIPISEIIYCESDGNYTRFFCEQNISVLISKKLGDYEKLLSSHGFYRIHRQCLVNINHIRRVIKQDGGAVIMSNNSKLEVSRRNKDQLYEVLAKQFLS